MNPQRLIPPMYSSKQGNILREVLTGLSQAQKILPAKILFDQKGVETFENVTDLIRLQQSQAKRNETYLNFFLKDDDFSAESYLIEPDCDGSKDIHFLLQGSANLLGYIPVSPFSDILIHRIGEFRRLFPKIKTVPVQGDLRIEEDLYNHLNSFLGRKVLFASSLMTSRSSRPELIHFFKKALKYLGGKTSFVFAFTSMTSQIQDQFFDTSADLWKNFTIHALDRLNREVSADFHLHDFRTETLFNKQDKRTDFYLVSKVDQLVKVNQSLFKIKKEESIQTLSLFNHSHEDVEEICRKVKLKINRTLDSNDSFMKFYELVRQK